MFPAFVEIVANRSIRSGNVSVYVNPVPRAPAVKVNERGRAGRQAQSCPKSKPFSTIYDAYAPKATSATVETQFRYRIARCPAVAKNPCRKQIRRIDGMR